MSEQIKYSALSDGEFVNLLRSKPEDKEWKVAEYREVIRRGKSILVGDRELEEKFRAYESLLRNRLKSAELEIDKSSLKSEKDAINLQLAKIKKIIPLNPLDANLDAINSVIERAQEINSIVNSAVKISSINVSQNAVNAINKQANDILRLATQATSIATSRYLQDQLSIAKTVQDQLSIAKAVQRQFSISASLINAAKRYAEMFAVIPNQILVSEKSYFASAEKNPISVVPTTSDELGVTQVVDSRDYENAAKLAVAQKKDRTVEEFTDAIGLLIEIRDGQNRSNEQHEETNRLINMTNGLVDKTNDLTTTTNGLVEKTNEFGSKITDLTKQAGYWTILLALLALWTLGLTFWMATK